MTSVYFVKGETSRTVYINISGLWSQVMKIVRETYRFVSTLCIIEDSWFSLLLISFPGAFRYFSCCMYFGKSTTLQKIISWAPPYLPSKIIVLYLQGSSAAFTCYIQLVLPEQSLSTLALLIWSWRIICC